MNNSVDSGPNERAQSKGQEQLKEQAFADIDANASALCEISHQIHANPELCYEEKFAHDILSQHLEDSGIAVERNAYGLETAFAAKVGDSGPQIAILCEYDALAGLGHACGHNIIGTAGVGAGIAAAKLAKELGGRLLILGTPAEEGGGGKVKLLENGAFVDVDAAIMFHPASHDLIRMNTLAVRQLKVAYLGRPAHSAAAPHKGLNALDAGVTAYNAISALRQHIRPTERVHGIFLEAGEQVNVVPSKCEMHWQIRSDTKANLEKLIPRVMNCLHAGAMATGCEVEISIPNPDYYEMADNDPLIAMFAANAALVGRVPLESDPNTYVAGSTDMGNVSQAVPSIHPMLKIAPAPVSIHTQEFAECAVSKQGDIGLLDGAKILAGVAVDFWSDEPSRQAIHESFQTQTQN